MMWNDNGMVWVDWLWMVPMMVLFWGALIALFVYAIRGFGSPRADDQAMGVLRARLASGAITQEEFERTRTLLQR